MFLTYQVQFVKLTKRRIRSDKEVVFPTRNPIHKCDNRACCNPEHLKIDTHEGNMRDARERGRTFALENSLMFVGGQWIKVKVDERDSYEPVRIV